MHELSGAIKDVSINPRTGQVIVNLAINEKQLAMACYDELHNCEKLSIKIGKWRNKRSNDANAYCFVLIGKLAEKLNIPKDEIYRNAIKQVGGNYEVVCVKNEAVNKLCEGWQRNGLGWQVDTMPSKIDGCTNVLLYYGSSTYDTAQMTRLINIIVADCVELGIDVRTPNEINSMLSLWEQSGVKK